MVQNGKFGNRNFDEVPYLHPLNDFGRYLGST